MFLDDEGLYVPGQRFFALPEDYIEPLAGRALVLGLDHSNGESIDAHYDASDILDSSIVFFEDIEDTSADMTVKQPKAAYVEQVYERTDFDELQI